MTSEIQQRRRQMSVATWVHEHRAEIDAEIRRLCPNVGTLNDRERRLWVLNDEGLYHLARHDGARV